MTTNPGTRARIRQRAPSIAALAVSLAWLSLGTASAEDAASPPGAIRFVGENAVATANGTFHSWRVTGSRLDLADLAGSWVEVEIDVASLDTGIERRDDHLRNPDFFEVERWPHATARVSGARRDGEDDEGRARYVADFELRIRDVTKTVPGTFVILSESPLAVRGGLTIDRTEWGIGKPKARFNPMSIGNEIPIAFEATIAAD